MIVVAFGTVTVAGAASAEKARDRTVSAAGGDGISAASGSSVGFALATLNVRVPPVSPPSLSVARHRITRSPTIFTAVAVYDGTREFSTSQTPSSSRSNE